MIQAGHEFGDGRATDWIEPQLLARLGSVSSRVEKEVHQPDE